MKDNRIEHRGRTPARIVIAAFIILAALAGLLFGFLRLRSIWLEQEIIQDFDAQVSITSGTMVKADVIAEEFGLKNGVNLARVDFAAKRAALLKKVPNLRAITISRRMPDRVLIVTEERTPVARLGFDARRGTTGKVVDAEGVVFIWQRDTRLLPIIREASAPGTPSGRSLNGRSRAALELLQMARESDFQDFGILEVSTSSPDFLTAIITTPEANYAKLKIAWEGMDENPTVLSTASLRRQLTHLRNAMRTPPGRDVRTWNATDFTSPGRIYADTKGALKP